MTVTLGESPEPLAVGLVLREGSLRRSAGHERDVPEGSRGPGRLAPQPGRVVGPMTSSGSRSAPTPGGTVEEAVRKPGVEVPPDRRPHGHRRTGDVAGTVPTILVPEPVPVEVESGAGPCLDRPEPFGIVRATGPKDGSTDERPTSSV